MAKQIFKNIVSEETLKEAYDHHSHLRKATRKWRLKYHATKEDFDIMLEDLHNRGFEWWDQLHKTMMKVAGVSKPWQLSDAARTEVICELCDYYDVTAPMYKRQLLNTQNNHNHNKPTTQKETQC